MDLLLIHPPACKPAEPPLGMAVLIGALRQHGFAVQQYDLNLEAYLYLLAPQRAERAAVGSVTTAQRRALKHADEALSLLRSPASLRSQSRYETAVRHLNTLLALYGESGEKLTLGDYTHDRLSPFSLFDLAQVVQGKATTLFNSWLSQTILPCIVTLAPKAVALSVNYRHQVLPAFALAGMLRRALPTLKIYGGGGMFSSWRNTLRAANQKLPPFDRIIFGPGEGPLQQLLTQSAPDDYWLEGRQGEYLPDFSNLDLPAYLSPRPVLPLTTSRGCYWQHCRFCPEAESPTHPYGALAAAEVPALLRTLTQRYHVQHLHLTDNAIPPVTLRALAAPGALPPELVWHGFVRFERLLCEPDLVQGLAANGCRLLQLGLESGSQAVLDRMGKGTQLDDVIVILKTLKKAGIATYVYIMVGTPGESREEAEATRIFLEEHADLIGYLNLSLMNLPREASLLETPQAFGICEVALPGDDAPLGLYQRFTNEGWGRREARRFLATLQSAPKIRKILQRTPPWFTSNHAFFFSPNQR
ncbi:MAG: radical SAM protein [Desulfuromonas sp.]|nr:MAG: radical SAM protein [Desulfuromonas sp.]